jgi:hypothetical protein
MGEMRNEYKNVSEITEGNILAINLSQGTGYLTAEDSTV